MDDAGDEDPQQVQEPTAEATAGSFEKTPMFTANNLPRYQRQSIISEIEAASEGRKLICYVSGVDAEIDRDDSIGFAELLYKIRPETSVDLMLHTPGGDVDAAEKLITMVQATVGSAELRVIVPDYAKSSGTLMAIGASEILMSDSSELGTIDPQVSRSDGCGSRTYHSVLGYIAAHEDARKSLDDRPGNEASRITFEKFDPVILRQYQAISDRARVFAQNQLIRNGVVAYTKIASDLMDINRFQSHGQMISCEVAKSIGLPVRYLPKDDPMWKLYWTLY